MKLTFHPASPIVSEETNAKFAGAFVDLLETVANVDASPATAGSPLSKLKIPEGSLSLAAAALGAIGLAIHAGAWSEFFSNLVTMKENVAVRLLFIEKYCSLNYFPSYSYNWLFSFQFSESSRFLGCVQFLGLLCRWTPVAATNPMDQ